MTRGVTDPLVRPGEITEIVGRLGSGRTSLFLTCLREITHDGGLAALVDADQAFDPRVAAEAGVDLRRLLWVRCGGRREVALRVTDILVRCPGFAAVGLDLGERPVRIPLTAGFRLKLAVRRTGTALVIIGRRRIAGPSASLAVATVQAGLEWTGPGPTPTRLARVRTAVQVLRARGAAPRPAVTRVEWWSP
ncbi:MAG: hypothetical protein HY727_10285 [Candidatus Rokubacteria bacterium]|nr:hypothetical protein [Candidatus Rokubacteria bacterium]